MNKNEADTQELMVSVSNISEQLTELNAILQKRESFNIPWENDDAMRRVRILSRMEAVEQALESTLIAFRELKAVL